jgi:hypothetical protein
MTGYKDDNHHAFDLAEVHLRQKYPEAFIFSPAANDKRLNIPKSKDMKGMQRENVMRLDYSYLSTCDHVVVGG